MGVASHRSFPGGTLPPEIEHVEPENDAFRKKFPFRGRLLFRFHVEFQRCKVDFALSLYGNGFAPWLATGKMPRLPQKEAMGFFTNVPMGLLGPSWINRRPLSLTEVKHVSHFLFKGAALNW